MIQSSHRFGLAASSPNLSESSLARWAAVLGFTSAHTRTVRARYASPHSPPAKLDSYKFGNSLNHVRRMLGSAPNPAGALPSLVQEGVWRRKPPAGSRAEPQPPVASLPPPSLSTPLPITNLVQSSIRIRIPLCCHTSMKSSRSGFHRDFQCNSWVHLLS